MRKQFFSLQRPVKHVWIYLNQRAKNLGKPATAILQMLIRAGEMESAEQ
jgi:hypothetical protein